MKIVNILNIKKLTKKNISYDLETSNNNFFANKILVHNSNMAVCYSQGELWVQGRKHIRTLLGDQNGMAAFVESTKEHWLELIIQLQVKYDIDCNNNTLVLDMEWAGSSIQKGNAACSGTDKAAYLFDYARIVTNNTNEIVYISTEGYDQREAKIYNMKSFGNYSITLDFNRPTECEAALKQMAESVEANSPIAAYFNKPDNVGEGVYLIGFHEGTMYRLKAKGEKHGGKPKEPRQSKLTDEQSEHLQATADKLTPVWRINQAITELNATELKHTGEVIKWVLADIVKEELSTLTDAKLTLKEVSGYVSKIVSTYYKDSIKGY